jgi:hypothetical protein
MEMQRLIVRLIILGVFAGGGWLTYQLADSTKCAGPRAEQWVDASLPRLEASNRDIGSVTEYTTTAQFAALAERAQARYVAQQDQSAPACLAKLQQETSNALYCEWKAYEAAAAGNFDVAVANVDRSEAARQAMEREYYRLAAEYDWDTSE